MQRARSAADKTRRSEDLLAAAQALAVELNGVRHVTLATVTERAGIHPSGVRRYFASKEELLLELAERGWGEWSTAVRTELGERTGLGPAETAAVIGGTLTAMPLFCDLLTHVPLSLEGDVDIERARRYKTNAFAAHDDLVAAIDHASTMTVEEIQKLVAAALAFAANFWQVSHPTATLAALYEQEPRWGHVALDFAPRVGELLAALAVGLSRQSR